MISSHKTFWISHKLLFMKKLILRLVLYIANHGKSAYNFEIFQGLVVTLFSSFAFLKTCLILTTLPSIMSDGATMSAPAFAKESEMAAIRSMLDSFSIKPVFSSTIPQ
jgi:hypothetical protein